MSVAESLRELAESGTLSAAEAAQFGDLADQIAVAESTKASGPVGSDLSVFIKNISLLGFVPALKQFILDVLNVK